MPRCATPHELELLAAYLDAGSCKGAADRLGVRPETLRHRLTRVYRRHDVTGMPQLVFLLHPDLVAYLAAREDGPQGG